MICLVSFEIGGVINQWGQGLGEGWGEHDALPRLEEKARGGPAPA